MVGVEIGLRNFLVAVSAALHYVQTEGVFIGAADGVSGVTIAANGELLAGKRSAARVDAALELLLDAVVALTTGGRHVGDIDA